MPTSDDSLPETTSLCPSCLERVPGQYERRDGSVFLRRTCPDHGETSRKVWESFDHWDWAAEFAPETDDIDPGASLSVENDHACLAVVNVTADCNLSCSYCFASSGPGGPHIPTATVVERLQTVIDSGGPRPVQFSGGEPTVRDDLPGLVERAGEMGFDHVQVNTNGIRLAEESGYAARLADAGVTAIYLQFDGLRSSTYEALREVDLAATKREAISACRQADLPVVLVPTVVPGVNDDELGDIVRFALDNLDVVQSVNFQPVAHFGRYDEDAEADADDPAERRFSADEAARRLAEQFDPLSPRDLLPVPCCSATCQMATALMPTDEGALALTQFLDAALFDDLAGFVDEGDWMELLASTPAGQSAACSAGGCCGVDVPGGAGELLDRALPVSFTGFMDADAADVQRLDDCCVSVPTDSGELVPFCAYNMTTDDGRYALRERNGWGGRSSVDATPESPSDLRPEASDDD